MAARRGGDPWMTNNLNRIRPPAGPIVVEGRHIDNPWRPNFRVTGPILTDARYAQLVAHITASITHAIGDDVRIGLLEAGYDEGSALYARHYAATLKHRYDLVMRAIPAACPRDIFPRSEKWIAFAELPRFMVEAARTLFRGCATLSCVAWPSNAPMHRQIAEVCTGGSIMIINETDKTGRAPLPSRYAHLRRYRHFPRNLMDALSTRPAYALLRVRSDVPARVYACGKPGSTIMHHKFTLFLRPDDASGRLAVCGSFDGSYNQSAAGARQIESLTVRYGHQEETEPYVTEFASIMTIARAYPGDG